MLNRTLAVGGQGFPMDITVTNNGESAYNSELHITIPEGVSVELVEDATDSSKVYTKILHYYLHSVKAIKENIVLGKTLGC